MTIWVGAGLAAAVGALGILRSGQPPTVRLLGVLDGLIFTLLIIAALTIAWVRGHIEFQVDAIDAMLAGKKIDEGTRLATAHEQSDGVIDVSFRRQALQYRAVVWLAVASALLLLTRAWVAPFATSGPTTTTTTSSTVSITTTVTTTTGTTSSTAPSFALARVLFATGRAEIRPVERRALDAMLDEARDLDRCTAIVRGSADRQGTERGNLWLSWRRANAVVGVLSAAGLDPWKITIVPRGDAESRGEDDADARSVVVRLVCSRTVS